VLVAYTDGITEVQNRQGEIWGQEGLEKLLSACQLVHSKMEDELRLDEMAKSAGLSTAHFSRVFRKSTGETPHQFVLRHRIERAKEMLRSAEERVLDVAVACGFKTQQHFARVFRRMCGVSPTEYRQEFLRHEASCALETCSRDAASFAAASSSANRHDPDPRSSWLKNSG
jgi:AraC family transcriptional regulator